MKALNFFAVLIHKIRCVSEAYFSRTQHRRERELFRDRTKFCVSDWRLAFVADFETLNFYLKIQFDMEHNTSTNHEKGNDANRLLAAVPMWTMVAERGHRYHFATDTFISLCGRDNLFVRDYVELIDGKMRKVGEGRQVFEAIPEYHSCKICLKVVRHGS